MAKNSFVVDVTFKDLKYMWNGIKKMISLNNCNYTIPTGITDSNKRITTSSGIELLCRYRLILHLSKSSNGAKLYQHHLFLN